MSGDCTGRSILEEPTITIDDDDSANCPFVSNVELISLQGDSNRNRLLRFYATINNIDVIILIDTGSSHDFISRKLLQKLNLEFTPLKSTVTFGNGKKGTVDGFIENLLVTIGDYNEYRDFDVALISDDIILGKPWLYDNNPDFNFRTNHVQFMFQGKLIKFDNCVDVTDRSAKLISRMQLERYAKKNYEIFVCYVKTITDDNLDFQKTESTTTVSSLLKEYEDVLPPELPNRLPPQRNVDHKIDIIPGSVPPFRSLFRYSFFERAELQKMLTDL
jgi:hypothetical protein